MPRNVHPPGAPSRAQYVTVEIFDQTYHLSGHNAEYIHALAARVDGMMRVVAGQGRTADSLRVAVLTAINLADELMQLEKRSGIETQPGNQRAAVLSRILDQLLSEECSAEENKTQH